MQHVSKYFAKLKFGEIIPPYQEKKPHKIMTDPETITGGVFPLLMSAKSYFETNTADGLNLPVILSKIPK